MNPRSHEDVSYSTNYTDAFIKAASDCKATKGEAPGKPGTIAQIQYALLAAKPYAMTSDDLLFEVHALRKGLDGDVRAARAAFFSKPQACLRASPLVKQFGWGLHHDAYGRIALVGVETAEYRAFVARDDLEVVPGMRSKRAV